MFQGWKENILWLMFCFSSPRKEKRINLFCKKKIISPFSFLPSFNFIIPRLLAIQNFVRALLLLWMGWFYIVFQTLCWWLSVIPQFQSGSSATWTHTQTHIIYQFTQARFGSHLYYHFELMLIFGTSSRTPKDEILFHP